MMGIYKIFEIIGFVYFIVAVIVITVLCGILWLVSYPSHRTSWKQFMFGFYPKEKLFKLGFERIK